MKTLAYALGIAGLLTLSVKAAAPLDVTMTGRALTSTSDIVTFKVSNPGHEAPTTSIFSLQGVWVAELTARSLGSFYWDGKDVDQQPVEPGMYVVQIRHNGSVWHGPVFVNY